MRLFTFILIAAGFCLPTNQSNAQNILVTAHRGASGLAPENTLASIRKAIELKADFAEIDVQETKDSVLIIVHDGNFKRTTGVDKNVWETDYADVKLLDAGSHFSDKFKGEPVPVFENVLDSIKGKIKLNIELKDNGHQQKLAERVVNMLEKKGWTDKCIITSFNFELIKKVRSINKNIKVGYIFSKYRENEDVFTADIDLFSIGKGLVDSALVVKAKQHGKEVHVWTVNDPAEMKRLCDLNVTSIITNFPDKLNAIIGKE